MSQDLIDIHQHLIEGNIPFATFRLPGETEAMTYVQTGKADPPVNSLDQLEGRRGFLMAPFYGPNGRDYLLVRPDLVFRASEVDRALVNKIRDIDARTAPTNEDADPHITTREDYLKQVEAIRAEIASGSFQKAVLSRIQLVEGAFVDMLPGMYQTLCAAHPNAFSYIFQQEGQLWMGASPEPLIRLREGRLSTISLAGTRSFAEEHLELDRWTLKEVLEQEYVTRFIHDAIRSFQIRDYRVSSPYVQKAGSLLHLRTDFSLDASLLQGRLWEFITAMHPTPAVAGQPKDEAVSFIRSLEPHKRDYYTGFLGPLGENGQMDLFVNLRCMRIAAAHLALYVGGGITLESNAEDEWDETMLKTRSLLLPLEPFLYASPE